MNVMESLLPLNLLLDEYSPRHVTGDFGQIVLRPHQSAALARCIDIESGVFKYECIPPDVLNNMIVYNMKSRIAAICDKTGAGKSYVVISLCVVTRNDPIPRAVHRISHANGLLSYTTEDEESNCIPTNVIVVPHGLIMQWTQYLEISGCGEDSYVYNRKNTATREDIKMKLMSDSPPLIVLCSSTCYPEIADILTTNKLRIRRLFIDEADSIRMSKKDLVGAAMYWFISASLDCLLCPTHTPSDSWEWKGVKSKSISTILDYFRYNATYIRTLLFVRCRESFVDASLELVDYVRNYVLCAAPAGTGLLKGIVDDKIMHALRTDDMERALSYVKQKGDSDNIVASLTKSWQSSLDNLILRMKLLDNEDEGLWTQQDHDFKKNTCRQADVYRKWLGTVKSRVNEENLCCICYDKPEHKAVMTCCTATYCFKCATKWISSHHSCPSCRSKATASSLHVIVDAEALAKNTRDKIVPEVLSKSTSALSLIDDLIKRSDSTRILLCCSNTAVFDRIDQLSRHGVAVLKGTGAYINNSVERFVEGKQKIMCISSGFYCSGINLPIVTDVIIFDRMDRSTEDQIIGRAQRPGRTGQLRVWYLVQDLEEGFEMANKVGEYLTM